MKTLGNKSTLILEVTRQSEELLHGRGNLSRDDLEYLVAATARLKDARLQACIAELIGWGDDERASLETLVAIGIECMKLTTPVKLAEAAKRVELRYHMRMPAVASGG